MGASLRWRISERAVYAARAGVAPAGAKGWLRVSMCQIASARRRAMSTWATLAPRCEVPPLLRSSEGLARVLLSGEEGDARCPRDSTRPYPPEFRREAVRLLETSGRSIPQVAGELGVSGESLRNWLWQDQLGRGERDDGLTSDEQEELRKLRRQVRELEQEREILKRAVAFLVRETDRR